MRFIIPHIQKLSHGDAAMRLPAFLDGNGHKMTRTYNPVSSGLKCQEPLLGAIYHMRTGLGPATYAVLAAMFDDGEMIV